MLYVIPFMLKGTELETLLQFLHDAIGVGLGDYALLPSSESPLALLS